MSMYFDDIQTRNVSTRNVSTRNEAAQLRQTEQANKQELPFEFSSFNTTKNGQVQQEDYSAYWGNRAEYTQAIFNYYDKDGIAGLSEEEFNNAKRDLEKIEEGGVHQLWHNAIQSLLDKGESAFSYTMIQKEAKHLEAKSFMDAIDKKLQEIVEKMGKTIENKDEK